MVAQRYRLSLLPARPAEVEAAVTLRPRRPMLMRVERKTAWSRPSAETDRLRPAEPVD
jgi:hypothetical protein